MFQSVHRRWKNRRSCTIDPKRLFRLRRPCKHENNDVGVLGLAPCHSQALIAKKWKGQLVQQFKQTSAGTHQDVAQCITRECGRLRWQWSHRLCHCPLHEIKRRDPYEIKEVLHLGRCVTHTHPYIYIHMYMLFTHTRTHTHIYRYLRTYMYKIRYTYTCTYTFTHAHTENNMYVYTDAHAGIAVAPCDVQRILFFFCSPFSAWLGGDTRLCFIPRVQLCCV